MEMVLAAFIGAALSFPHCLGMCGAFTLHLAKDAGGGSVLARQLCWHAGRIATYVFLGSLAAFAGSFLASASFIPHAQNVLAVVLGAFMIAMGLVLMGLIPARKRRRVDGAAPDNGILSGFLRQLFGAPTRAGALALGLATGFLPCPVVLGFLALSAHSASVLTGMMIMAAMGLGTVWSLLALGLTGGLVGARLRRWGVVLGGIVLILAGAATALRATTVFHRWLGCPPASVRPADNAPDCCSPPER
jgi:sulfite exporter TauE/SafE